MKKLFALVLVLAMALAIAAPALASGWDLDPVPAVDIKGITVKLTPLKLTKTTGIGGGFYETLPAAYPVVAGTELHFYVEIVIPKEANLSAANKKLLANKKLTYKLALTEMALTEANCEAFVDTGSGYAPRAGFTAWLGETFTTSDIGYKFGYEYWATAKSAKAPKAVASIGYYNTWDGDVFGWDNNADGENEFIVTKTAYGFKVAKASDAQRYIEFPVDHDTGKVKADGTASKVRIGYDEVQYNVGRTVTNEIAFWDGGNVVGSGELYKEIKADFDAYFKALGFGYEGANYMTTKNFSDKFGKIAYDSSEYAWAAGAVIVDPNAPKPPQTGDASTVAGFVMIALALVAAAAVTVKKVRA